MITRKQAWEKLTQMIDNKNLIAHCIAVESAMRSYAKHFNIPSDDHEKWAIAGLLHDADWEKHPDKHPQIIIEWLKEQNQPEDLHNAIAAHGFNFNIEAKTQMAQTLRAVDELTGLIVAVALVKGKKLANVSVSSVKKKWKDKTFAKGVSREDIERGAEEIGIPLDKHIEIVLTALQNNAQALGL